MSRTEVRKPRPLSDEFIARFLEDPSRILQRASDLIEVELRDPMALQDFAAAIARGCAGVTHSNHISLGDALAEVVKMQMIQEATEGAVQRMDLVIAKSLERDMQGTMTKMYVKLAKPFLSTHGVNLDFSVTTKNDRLFRGIRTSNRAQEEAYFDISPQEGVIFAIYPEGTVEGGRKDKATKKPYGMRRVKADNLEARYIDAMRTKGTDVVVLPSATVGTEMLLNPGDPKLPDETLFPYLLGYESAAPHAAGQIKLILGSPFVVSAADTKQVSGTDLMRTSVPLLPQEYRGVYAVEASGKI